jgi:hypothetical protein
MNEPQVNSQAVVNSLVRQIAEQAQKIAFLEAFIETLQSQANPTEESNVG